MLLLLFAVAEPLRLFHLYNFVEGAAMDFNRVMTTNIDRHLTPFIRPK